MPPLRRCAPTACPDERGTTVRISLDWVSEWRGIRSQTTEERDRIKALERENRELRKANEILRLASAYFAQAELDRRNKP